MIDNKNIFSCEELDHEKSQEDLPVAILAIGAFLHFVFLIWILISSLTDNIRRKSESKKEEKVQKKIKSNIDDFKNVWRKSFERRLKCEEIIKQTFEKSFSDYKFKKELFEYNYKDNTFYNKDGFDKYIKDMTSFISKNIKDKHLKDYINRDEYYFNLYQKDLIGIYDKHDSGGDDFDWEIYNKRIIDFEQKYSKILKNNFGTMKLPDGFKIENIHYSPQPDDYGMGDVGFDIICDLSKEIDETKRLFESIGII